LERKQLLRLREKLSTFGDGKYNLPSFKYGSELKRKEHRLTKPCDDVNMEMLELKIR
jgi:hypothetical protein